MPSSNNCSYFLFLRKGAGSGEIQIIVKRQMSSYFWRFEENLNEFLAVLKTEGGRERGLGMSEC